MITSVLGTLLLTSCDSATPAGDETTKASPSREAGAVEPIGGPLAADASLAEALAHPDPLLRCGRVAQILQSATPKQLPEIQAEFERAPLAWGDLEYALFVGWWARFDPNAALSYAENDIRLDHPRVFADAMRAWGRRNPMEAVRSGWLVGVSMGSPGWRSEMVEALVTGWFESGDPGLEKWLQTEVEPNSVTSALRAYVRMRILRDGARETLEWARTAPFPPTEQRLLLANAMNIAARMEPMAAVEYLAIAEKDGVDTRTFPARIARGWAQLDPRAAMEWLMKTDVDPVEQQRAVPDVVRIWLTRDEDTLEAYLADHVGEDWTDPLRRQAIRHNVLQHNYRVDWPKLMKRVSEIKNEEGRRLEYLWVIQRWKGIDPASADAWLAENSALLGDKLQYADQLHKHEREAIQRVLEAEARR